MAAVQEEWRWANKRNVRPQTRRRKKYPTVQTITPTCIEIANTKLWFPFPNLEYARSVSLSRKLLEFNYAFSHNTKDHKPEYPKLSPALWYNTLEQFRNRNAYRLIVDQRQIRITQLVRTDDHVMKQNLMTYGISENRALAAISHIKTMPKPNLEQCLKHITEDGQIMEPGSKIFLIWNANRYSTDQDQNSTCISPSADVTTATSYINPFNRGRKIRKIIKSNNVNDDDSDYVPPPEKEHVPMEHTVEWQMLNWQNPIWREYFSAEVNEILSNRCFREMTVYYRTHRRTNQPLTEKFLMALKLAFFKHEWFKVANTIKGLCTTEGITSRRSWLFWNAGFYSIIRFEKTIGLALAATRQLAIHFSELFTPLCYERRLGVEVAIWLTQEGRFLEGVKFLKEMDELGRLRRCHGPGYSEEIGLKRDQVDFVFHLILAVHTYAMYIRDTTLHKKGLFSGTETDLHRCAEVALSEFERLSEFANECESEITTYLEQLIELTIKCRSPETAKKVFDKIVVQYYGNAYVERAYLKFLSKYFKDIKNEISKNLKLRRKFRFTTPPSHWGHQGRSIATYVQRKLEVKSNMKPFNKLPNPSFSV
ncbi:uncharacterized protein LOC110843810 isoform X2 [Folsomia candida]|uniref:Uncharacterized protein n=2 Tax=Folsomia candida TaxID=158441 RepID=A0A226ERM4_FOLCA|nr:uncharacterized protein LOC110843810 isoform X2 [Folsomia candida]XP_035703964.1 uncharacterized protein LOC110843810 isoform X2 [Folsomia candida]OXA59704.1 hypothetical protein Fcan01_04984 [Folsomia candida]